MDFTKIYIDGAWISPNSKEFIEVENPSTREIIDRVPRSNEEDVQYAIESAKRALKAWEKTEVETRIGIMEKFIGELEANKVKMAELISLELGAPFDFAKETHIESYLENGKDFIELARKYEFEEQFDKGYIVRREAVGVVACITPWNYPLGQIMKKVVPAILAGNTVILKPSQNTPLISYYVADAFHKAGLPKGVFNLVTGRGGEVGNILASHKDIDMVSFTGSTKGGIEVGKLGLESVKKLALELGGKSASIILDDGDLETAYDIIWGTIFKNTGQTCSALSRVLVPRKRKQEFEDYFVKRASEITYGPASDNLDLGPLASLKQWDKVTSYLDLGLKEGAKMIFGEIPKDNSKGYFISPIIFTDVENSMRIAQEEIFGPVLVVIYYDDLDEAIEIANDSEYGLSGAVFGGNDMAQKVARQMKTGTVIVNNGKRSQAAPFGGYKKSGIGREGGIYGFEEFLEIKTIFS